MKHQPLLLIFVLFQVTLYGQTSISGIVISKTGESLPGANIYLEGTYDGTSSNAEGSFKLESSAKGRQLLCIEYIGYEKYTLELQMEGGSIQLSSIILREELNELTAVSITAGTFEAGDKKKSIALSSIDMVTTDGSSGDVYGALQALPGTSTVGESGKLFVKGGDSRESKTYIDGTLVYVPYSSSSPNASVRGRFSPFMFSGMMFSTGGYSAEYGQALSSVLSLQTNAMPLQDELNISILSVGLELGGTKAWENSALSASIAYNNLTPYMKLVPQYTQWEKEPRALAGDMSFRLKTRKSGMLKFYSTINRSALTTIEDKLNNPGTSINYDLVNNNQFINASWKGEVKKDWILSTGFSYTNNQDKVAVDSLAFNESLQGSHTKVMLKYKVSNKLRIQAGTEWYARTYGTEYPGAEKQTLSAYTNHTLTAFLEAEVYASSSFVIRAGSRYEYGVYLKRSSIAPRISAAYKTGKMGQISLAYGWFYQDPENAFLLQSKDLNYELAKHYTLNYLVNGNGRMLRTELYFKEYKNLVKYQLNSSLDYDFINNEGDGQAYGLDFFWRDKKSIKNGEYWISYSYIESKRNYLDYPHEANHAYTSRHNLSLIYKQWFDRLRSQFAANYSISSPRYYNDPNSPVFNGERTLSYQSLNVNWSYLPRQNLIIYVSVSNLLGQEQEFGYKYASRPNEKGIYASAPILPTAKRWILIGCFITLSRSGDINQLDKIN